VYGFGQLVTVTQGLALCLLRRGLLTMKRRGNRRRVRVPIRGRDLLGDPHARQNPQPPALAQRWITKSAALEAPLASLDMGVAQQEASAAGARDAAAVSPPEAPET